MWLLIPILAALIGVFVGQFIAVAFAVRSMRRGGGVSS